MTEQSGNQAGARMLAGRYAVLSELGRGGMGVVWRGEDTVIGRPVAIKELRLPDGLGEHERQVYTERVLREARTAGRLNDPAVITVYDVVSENGITYIVMELVEAETLAELLRRIGPLPMANVAAIGRQVLSALQVAHAAGIMHRDVKPSNIMVSAAGRVKLTDFGIAQALDDPRLTVSGTVVGSPAFMAPERLAERDVTPAADLWSLGATLFTAVEGYAPFERSNTAATLHAIMNDVPYLTRCQGPLASAIMGLLTTNPQGRLSADQAAGLLDLAANPQPGAVAQPSTPIGPGMPHDPTRHYAPHGLTALARAPRPRPSGRKVAMLVSAAVIVLGGVFVGGVFAQRGWGSSADPAMAPTMTYGPGGQIPAFEISSSSYDSTCISGALRPGRKITSDLKIDCKNPHELELYSTSGTFDPSDSSSQPDVAYPGKQVLTDYAQSWCSLVFESSRVARPDKDGALRFTALVPTEQAWDGRGTDTFSGSSDKRKRSIYCIVAAGTGGQLTGSVLAKGK